MIRKMGKRINPSCTVQLVLFDSKAYSIAFSWSLLKTYSSTIMTLNKQWFIFCKNKSGENNFTNTVCSEFKAIGRRLRFYMQLTLRSTLQSLLVTLNLFNC